MATGHDSKQKKTRNLLAEENIKQLVRLNILTDSYLETNLVS